MAKVVIVGHSFVSRLRDFENHELFLRLQNCNDATENGIFVGKSGADIGMIRTLLAEQVQCDSASQTGPDVGFLVIGSNYACSGVQSASELAFSIFALARYLIVLKFARHVIIGQLLPRFKRHSKYFNSDLSLDAYTSFICEVNSHLAILISKTCNVFSLCKFRGFWNEEAYAADGCHPANIEKNANSVKHEILSAYNALLSNENLSWQDRSSLVKDCEV